MYTASNVIYHEQTSACTSTTIDPSGRCRTCYERTNFSVSYSRNEAYTVRIHVQPITVKLNDDLSGSSGPAGQPGHLGNNGSSVFRGIPDFHERRPWLYRPAMRAADKNWRASRRIIKQRPRDGLHE